MRYSRRRYRNPYRRFKRRYRRRSRRGGINATRSRTVRISSQLSLPFTIAIPSGSSTYYPIPLVFTPTQLPGFIEYASTYSEFRILKARCKVHLAVPGDEQEQALLSNQPYTYLRVPSRPYIEDTALGLGTGAGGSPTTIQNIIVSNSTSIDQLRQSRWQRQYYPSDIKNSVSFKFYPYTLAWCGRPVGNTVSGAPGGASGNAYVKYQSGRQWMPMSFLAANSTVNDDVSFLGPYFVRLFSSQPDSQAIQQFTPVVTLTVYCQFRGQK